MKFKWGLIFAVLLSAVTALPVMAQESGSADFRVGINGEYETYPESEFISVVDSVLKDAGADTNVEIMLNKDIDTGRMPVVIWNGNVTLDLNGHTLTCGSEGVDSEGRGIEDNTAWREWAQCSASAYSSVIAGPGTTFSVKNGTIQVPEGMAGADNSIDACSGSSVSVADDVLLECTSNGIEAFGANVLFKGTINSANDEYVAGGIHAMDESAVTIEGGRICCESNNTSYSSYAVYIDDTSDFVMKGGEITLHTKSYGIGVFKTGGTGVFRMSGAKSGSTSKSDITINVDGLSTLTGGWPTASGIYVDDYEETAPAYIKNTDITVYSETGDYVEGIRFENGPGTDVLIENCKIDSRSGSMPESEFDMSPYEVSGIFNFCNDCPNGEFNSLIRNVEINCEGNGDVTAIRGYDIDGAVITAKTAGLYYNNTVEGIEELGEKDTFIRNATVNVSGESANVFAVNAWTNVHKITLGKNCVFDAEKIAGGWACALVDFDDEAPYRYVAEDGKFFDREGKTIAQSDLRSATYVQTSKGRTPAPSNVRVALSKAKFAWDGRMQGTKKSPYVIYDGTEKMIGFSITASDGTTLLEGSDYSAEYIHSKNNMAGAGKVTVKIKAIEGGRCTGSITKTYSIRPAKLSDVVNDPNISGDDEKPVTVFVSPDAPIVYKIGGVRPGVELYFDGQPLEAGKDYAVVKYINNKAAASADASKAPAVRIKGKGNYTGTVNIKFAIEPENLDPELQSITVPDVIYSSAPGKFKSKPVIKVGKKKLKAGRDYSVDMYSVSSNMIEPLSDTAAPEERTTVYVQISGMNNYQGTYVGSYTIRIAMLNKCSAVLAEGVTLPENADSVTADMLTVVRDKVTKTILIPYADYDIQNAEYTTVKGKKYLKVTIVGVDGGLYGGSRTVKIRL